MTAREVVALNEDTPQLEAPQAGDTYLLPRDTTIDGDLTVTGAFSISGTALLADGSVPLTANWDAGSYKITAQQLESDVVTGTPPLIVASTTVVPNLNVNYLQGSQASAFATAAQGATADTALQQDGTTPLTGDWNAGTNAISTSGVITGGALITESIYQDDNAGSMRISSGTAVSSGANLELHSQSDGVVSYDVHFRSDNTTELQFDSSINTWHFQANNITTTGIITGGSLIVDNITIDAAAITSDTGAISFDNENLSTTGTLDCGALTSTGIDDNATAERIELADNYLAVGGTQTIFSIIRNAATAGVLQISASGTIAANGFKLYADDHGTQADDMEWIVDSVAELHYDHSASTWDFNANDITTTGSVTASAANNVQAGTSYTIQASDNGKNIIFTNGSAIAVTLPDTLATDFQCTIIQAGAGVPTVTPDTDTINGAGTGVTPDAQWKGMYLTQYADTLWLAIF